MKIAYLAHIPECDFESYGVEFERDAAAKNIAIGAFSTIEGEFLRGYLEHTEFEVYAISFSKFVSVEQVRQVSPRLTVHILPAKRLTGMSVAWLPRALQVRKILRQVKPDAVHGMRTLEGYGLMAMLSGYRHIVTVEEFLVGIPAPLHLRWSFAVARQVERLTLKHCQQVVSISEHVSKTIKRMGRTKPISMIPNVASECYYAVERLPPRHFLYVGRIAEEKGLKDALLALDKVHSGSGTAQLIIIGAASGAGGDAYLADCVRLGEEMNSARVDYLGVKRAKDIAGYHSSTYALIMPSIASYEGMPVVIAEALAAGTPVITYDKPPMSELVEDKVTGFLVPSGNIDDLARAMEHCMDPAWHGKASAQAKCAGMQYSTMKVAESYAEILSSESIT